MKANPERVLAGTSRLARRPTSVASLSETLTGSHIQFIPYRGNLAGNAAGPGGRADRPHLRSTGRASLPQLQDGTIRSYAVMFPPVRAQAAPGIPTVDEAGLLRALSAGVERDVGTERTRPRTSSTNSMAPTWRASPTPPYANGSPTSARKSIRANAPADTGSAACLSKGRDREMVADRQGRRYQSGMSHPLPLTCRAISSNNNITPERTATSP